MMHKIITLQDKIAWATRGVTIGDALWLPVENMRSAAIIDTFWAFTEYLPVSNHNKIVEYVVQKKWYAPILLDQTWVISDDAILTLAGIKSIIESWKIDIVNLFSWHKKMHGIYWGYGFSETVDNKLKKYDGSSDFSQLHIWLPSYGNGVLMKQMPYAAYYYALYLAWKEHADNMDNIIAYITSVTHNTPIAKTISVLHNKVLLYLFQKQPQDLDIDDLLHMIQELASRYDRVYGCNGTDDTTMPVSPIIEKLLQQQQSIKAWNPYTYKQILDTYLISYKDEKMNKGMRRWYHVASTFGIVYALFLQQQDFPWLMDAIYIWYDTDSQASILGGMIWALRWPFYNAYYINAIVHSAEIQNTVSQFQHILEHISKQSW